MGTIMKKIVAFTLGIALLAVQPTQAYASSSNAPNRAWWFIMLPLAAIGLVSSVKDLKNPTAPTLDPNEYKITTDKKTGEKIIQFPRNQLFFKYENTKKYLLVKFEEIAIDPETTKRIGIAHLAGNEIKCELDTEEKERNVVRYYDPKTEGMFCFIAKDA